MSSINLYWIIIYSLLLFLYYAITWVKTSRELTKMCRINNNFEDNIQVRFLSIIEHYANLIAFSPLFIVLFLVGFYYLMDIYNVISSTSFLIGISSYFVPWYILVFASLKTSEKYFNNSAYFSSKSFFSKEKIYYSLGFLLVYSLLFCIILASLIILSNIKITLIMGYLLFPLEFVMMVYAFHLMFYQISPCLSANHKEQNILPETVVLNRDFDRLASPLKKYNFLNNKLHSKLRRYYRSGIIFYLLILVIWILISVNTII